MESQYNELYGAAWNIFLTLMKFTVYLTIVWQVVNENYTVKKVFVVVTTMYVNEVQNQVILARKVVHENRPVLHCIYATGKV